MDGNRSPDVGESIVDSARHLSAGVAGGFLAGVLIGGVGGRLAMLLLRLTSDPSVQGVTSDDGFTIGVVSGETAFLLVGTAVLGALGGVLYLAVRRWIPRRLRPWTMGTMFGLVGGAVVVRPGGVDFTLLSPLWLAIALFIALPALFGVTLVLLTERLLRDDSPLRRGRAWIVGLLPLILAALFGGAGLLVAFVAVGAWAIGRASPAVVAVWRSAPVAWIGRTLIAVVCAGSFVVLVRDSLEIL